MLIIIYLLTLILFWVILVLIVIVVLSLFESIFRVLFDLFILNLLLLFVGIIFQLLSLLLSLSLGVFIFVLLYCSSQPTMSQSSSNWHRSILTPFMTMPLILYRIVYSYFTIVIVFRSRLHRLMLEMMIYIFSLLVFSNVFRVNLW